MGEESRGRSPGVGGRRERRGAGSCRAAHSPRTPARRPRRRPSDALVERASPSENGKRPRRPRPRAPGAGVAGSAVRSSRGSGLTPPRRRRGRSDRQDPSRWPERRTVQGQASPPPPALRGPQRCGPVRTTQKVSRPRRTCGSCGAHLRLLMTALTTPTCGKSVLKWGKRPST